jgi:hypothetical protein
VEEKKKLKKDKKNKKAKKEKKNAKEKDAKSKKTQSKKLKSVALNSTSKTNEFLKKVTLSGKVLELENSKIKIKPFDPFQGMPENWLSDFESALHTALVKDSSHIVHLNSHFAFSLHGT